MKVSKFTTALLTVASFMVFVPSYAFSSDAGIGDVVSQAAPKGPNAALSPGHYGMISGYADNYLTEAGQVLPNGTRGYRNIAVNTVVDALNNGTSNYFIVDVRQCADYCTKGHLPGAVNIPYQVLAKPWNLAKLPTDNSPIVAMCYTGQIGGQATAVLNMLGYNAYNLRFGALAITPSSKVDFGGGPVTVYGYPSARLEKCDPVIACN